MLVPFQNLGQYGIITDVSPHKLPPNAWSGGKNVRMYNGRVQKFLGHQQVFGTPTKAPYWMLPCRGNGVFYWVYNGFDGSSHKMYSTDMSSHTNITRQSGGVDVDYDNSAYLGWTGGILGGVPLFNNGVDAPQFWDFSGRLANLTNWPASTSCAAMRVFRQFAIALDVTKSSTRYKEMVKWSHPADPGSVPSSWDETDATKDAGEQPLSDSSGAVVDCLVMRGNNIIYKDDAVHLMQYSGQPGFPFNFRGIFDEWGILARNCAIPFFGGKHLVATGGDLDIVVHDGVNADSILEQKIRSYLRNDIDSTNYTHSYMVTRWSRNEVWFCYPGDGDTYATRALVWNWKDGTFGFRDIPTASYGKEGIVDPGAVSDAWDDDSGYWNDDTTTWDQATYNAGLRSPLFATPGDTKFYQGDATNQFAGVNMTSYIERLGLTVIGMDSKGNLASDLTQKKYISELWPKIYMEAGGTVDVTLYAQDIPEGPTTVYGPYTFDPNSDLKVDVGMSARLWGVKFSSDSNVDWELAEFAAEIVPDGVY